MKKILTGFKKLEQWQRIAIIVFVIVGLTLTARRIRKEKALKAMRANDDAIDSILADNTEISKVVLALIASIYGLDSSATFVLAGKRALRLTDADLQKVATRYETKTGNSLATDCANEWFFNSDARSVRTQLIDRLELVGLAMDGKNVASALASNSPAYSTASLNNTGIAGGTISPITGEPTHDKDGNWNVGTW